MVNIPTKGRNHSQDRLMVFVYHRGSSLDYSNIVEHGCVSLSVYYSISMSLVFSPSNRSGSTRRKYLSNHPKCWEVRGDGFSLGRSNLMESF